MYVMLRRKWLVLWSLWAARIVRQPTLPVQLASSGALVRGQVAPDGSHTQYFGIPYAKVQPDGRFQAPGAEPVWEGVRDAVDEHVRCAQVYVDAFVVGSEDCLVLNVYVPMQAALAPVMVFIHGGGFKEGAGSRLLYGPDYLVSKGVVLVTFNYRLSAAGFLCLGIKEAPGNAGLKDQLAALKWVQKNIKAFGGDPDNVTIFGQSVGAASVSLHVVSKVSKGLFHKAITQSGSSLSPWAVQTQPLHTARAVAAALGHNVSEPFELYQVLMTHSMSELVMTRVPLVRGAPLFAQLVHTPCIERSLPGVEPFLTESPQDILSKGEHNKVPMIIGTNYEEGYFFAALEDESSMKELNFEKGLPNNLYFHSDVERRSVAEEFRKHYMGNREISSKSIVEVSRLHGHPHFQYPVAAETALLARSATILDPPIYSYVFAHDGWRNFAKLVAGWGFWRLWLAPGATHADELFYLFRLFPVPTLFESDVIDTMTAMWTNFAKFGSPDKSRWRAVVPGANETHVLLLGRDVHEISPPHQHALDLWRRIYSTYGRRTR